MWTWDAILAHFEQDAQWVRPGWEDAQTNARVMLALIPRIQQRAELKIMQPFLAHGTLCLYHAAIDKSISVYSSPDARSCRIALHEDQGALTSLWEGIVPIDDIVEVIVDKLSANTE